MNNKRRKEIRNAITQIEILVQNILDEEQEAFDSMPEGLQESENGIISQESQDNLELAIESLNEAIEYLEDIN